MTTLGFLPFFQRAKRGIEAFDTGCLRRHENRAGNVLKAVTPVRQRNTVFCGNMRNYVLEMFDVFFELLMIHCFPRILLN